MNSTVRRNKNREKNSFRNAVFFIALLAAVVALASYLFFYLIFADFTKREASSANSLMTESLTYTISEMDSSIRNFCVSQFFASDIQYLMNVTSPDNMTIQQTITRLKHSAASNLNIQSIAAFNNNTGILYSTLRGITDADEEMKKIILTPGAKQLTPIPRVIPVRDYYSETPVFSYFLCDGSSDTRINSALVVNLYADWLGKKLKSISTEEQEHLVIFDAEFHVLADNRGTVTDFSGNAPDYCHNIISDASTRIRKINGEKNYVAVSPIGNTGWFLLREVPCRTIMEEFHSLELTLLAFTISVLILAVFLSFAIVRRIYAPIEQVADFLQEKTNMQTVQKKYDALAYISQTVQSVEENMQALRKSSGQLLRENTLRLLLAGEPSLRNSEESAVIVEEIEQMLKSCRICILRAPFSAMLAELPTEQRVSTACDIAQMIQCYIPGEPSVGMISTSADERTMLIANDYSPENVRERFGELQKCLEEQYGFTLSCFLETENVESISAHQRFMRMQKVSQYSMFFDAGCFLDSGILSREKLPFSYPADQVQSMVNSIKRNETNTALHQYRQFSETVRETNNYDNYQLCVMQLFLRLKTLESELSSYTVSNSHTDMDAVYIALNNVRLCSQIDAVFEELIESMCAPDKDVNGKHSVLLASVREYIGLHYSDKELCPKQIAADFNISYSYLGRLFREYYGQSVKEYITAVRLDVAADHLTSGNMSIKKIMDITGFDNESNFFRLFRTRFGITPNNYRLHQSISKNQSSEP